MAEARRRGRRRSEPDFAALTGTWRAQGYGSLLEIGPDGYTLHEETRISCLPVAGGSLEELAEHWVELRLSSRRRVFSARRAEGVTRVNFRRLKAPPAGCAAPSPERRADPEYNFEVFWHTLAEYYALFELKEVDWEAAYERYRPRVDAGTPPDRLYGLFVSMLRPLRDGHVQLHASCGHFDAGAPAPLHHRLSEELARADDARDVASYLAELREWLRETIQEDYLHSRRTHSGGRHLEWGRLDEAVGYLNIRAMAGLCGRLGRPRADLETADAVMQRVMDELGGLETLVVDLRGNGGGYDAVALRLAGYLIDRKRLAFTKSARQGPRHTGRQPVYVEPRGDGRYAGGIVALTSGLTASAAEVFILALLQHPRLTLVGEPTHGILSDAMERHLPNGWYMTLSNEVYHAADGAFYEGCGVPPHVEIPFLDKAGREAGRDSMLDFVLESSRG